MLSPCTSCLGQLTLQTCIPIKQSFLITVTFLTVLSHLIFLDHPPLYFKRYISLNCVFMQERLNQRSVLWFHSEHVTCYDVFVSWYLELRLSLPIIMSLNFSKVRYRSGNSLDKCLLFHSLRSRLLTKDLKILTSGFLPIERSGWMGPWRPLSYS